MVDVVEAVGGGYPDKAAVHRDKRAIVGFAVATGASSIILASVRNGVPFVYV